MLDPNKIVRVQSNSVLFCAHLQRLKTNRKKPTNTKSALLFTIFPILGGHVVLSVSRQKSRH